MNSKFESIYRNKIVLITGHTGFKGSWLSIWLNEMGANIIGYSLEPYTNNDNFVVTGLKDKIQHIIGDVRDFRKLQEVFDKYKPEFVFHLAAQPIVKESYMNPKETYDINIGGTTNILECCRLSQSVKVIINVTSDKCYENKEWIWGYRESDTLGGLDPYSSSKGCSELITAAYRKSFLNSENSGKAISTVRTGNVIGGGDWQKYRLIPDCIRSLKANKPIEIRNPHATRPWQHVLDPLNGYLLLAAKMYENSSKYSGAWNFGPKDKSVISVSNVVSLIIENWGNGKWIDNHEDTTFTEANLLSLDISKAKKILGWEPKWTIKDSIQNTIEWYQNNGKRDIYSLCVNQINRFVEI